MTETVTAGDTHGAMVGAAPRPGALVTGRTVADPARDDAGTDDTGAGGWETTDPESTGPETPVPETRGAEGTDPEEAGPEGAAPETAPPKSAGRERTDRERPRRETSGRETSGRAPAEERGRFDFTLPAELEATAPPEARGRSRDGVRLLTARRTPDGDEDTLTHGAFTDLPGLLRPGDLLVVNTSPTLPAAVRLDRIAVHFSTPLPSGCWLVELREIGRSAHPARTAGGTAHAAGETSPEGTAGAGSASGAVSPARGSTSSAARAAAPATGVTTGPYAGGEPGEWLPLPGGATLTLLGRHTPRLWQATLDTPVVPYLHRHGVPIRYGYVTRDWPLAAYQTVFARAGRDGGAEMPSAGRAFTTELVTRLVAGGVLIAPITLHTGVASPEAHEPPYPERFRVPATTASVVNDVRRRGGRVIAVGTTVVRALETATGEDGRVRAAHGWTDLVATPERGVRTVDGLLTGLHEPRSSHLRMLTAIAGDALVERSYAAALEGRYLWHEFGDLNLLLP